MITLSGNKKASPVTKVTDLKRTYQSSMGVDSKLNL